MESLRIATALRSEFIKYSPRVISDSTDSGEECAELIFDAEGERLHLSVSIRASEDACSVWLGGVCVSSETPTGDVASLIRALLDGKIAVVSKYRNHSRYEAKEPYFERVFVIDNDAEFEEYVSQLKKPRGIFNRLWNGDGVFVISKYEGREIIDGKNS